MTDMTAGRAAEPPGTQRSSWRSVATKVLQLGFLFFLAKGVAWLILGWLAWRLA